MQKIKNNLRRFIKSPAFPVFLIFAIFSVLVLLQHHYVWFYHDDYGYGSLSYAYDAGITGHNFSLPELNDFLIGHYINWGGRILYFAIDCVLLSLGVHAWRIVQSIIIVAIFYCIYRLISKYFKKPHSWKLALLTVSTYGFIGIMVARDGIFWATASVLYLFPLLPFLLFVLLYNKTFKKPASILFQILLCFLIFISTFSYEQISAAALFYIILNTIINWVKTKKLRTIDIVLSVVGLTGFLILLLAPGNTVRVNHPTSVEFYALPLFERILSGISSILENFFSNTNSIFLFFFLASSSIYAALNLKAPISKNKYIKSLNTITLFSNCLIFLFNTIFSVNGGYYSILNSLSSNHLFHILISLFITAQCLLLIYAPVAFLFKTNCKLLAELTICALVSLCIMAVAPYFPSRAILVFEFFSMPAIIYITYTLLSKSQHKAISPIIMTTLVVLSLANIADITLGYRRNNSVNHFNDQTLSETAEKITAGEDIKSIELLKLPDPLFGSDQPYDQNREYILMWIKKYYNLPENITIEYVSE